MEEFGEGEKRALFGTLTLVLRKVNKKRTWSKVGKKRKITYRYIINSINQACFNKALIPPWP